MASRQLFRVAFTNQGKVYEVYARKVSEAGMLGFIAIEGLVFGERSSVVVDPSEERLRDEFSGVKRFHVPIHSVIRIDEVEKQGPARIVPLEGGVPAAAFPLPGTGKDRA
jgi:hypothetical protein